MAVRGVCVCVYVCVCMCVFANWIVYNGYL